MECESPSITFVDDVAPDLIKKGYYFPKRKRSWRSILNGHETVTQYFSISIAKKLVKKFSNVFAGLSVTTVAMIELRYVLCAD